MSNENKQNYIYMAYGESYSSDPSEGYSNDPYTPRPDRYTHFTPTGFFVDKPDWSEHIPVSFKPVKGKKIWVVIVTYSDGDTFSTMHGLWTIQGVYLNEADAKRAYDKVLKEKDLSPNFNAKPYVSEPWKGYFASLESVDIYSSTLRLCSDKRDPIIKEI